MQKFSQNPVLVALIAGQAGHDLEAMEDGKIVEEVTGILHRIYKNDLALKPTSHIITRWKSDRHARGTYSYIAQGSSGNDYDVLAKPLDNKIFFAGEATNKFQPATVAGALHSGLREAQRIHRYAYINLHKLRVQKEVFTTIHSWYRFFTPPAPAPRSSALISHAANSAKKEEQRQRRLRRFKYAQSQKFSQGHHKRIGMRRTLGSGNQELRYKFQPLFATVSAPPTNPAQASSLAESAQPPSNGPTVIMCV
jgi:lysine-specific histone demethylase 1